MIRAGEEWQGLLGARQLVDCSVQDLVALPVLWNGKFPRRERHRSGLAGRARSGLERSCLGVVVRTRGLIAQQRIAADNQPAVASLRGLLSGLPLNANVGRTDTIAFSVRLTKAPPTALGRTSSNRFLRSSTPDEAHSHACDFPHASSSGSPISTPSRIPFRHSSGRPFLLAPPLKPTVTAISERR